MNEKEEVQEKSIMLADERGLSLTTLDEMWRFATIIDKSGLAPTAFKGKKEAILIAIQMGFEVGLSPMAALQGIAVINGRPLLYGTALGGIIQGHRDCEYLTCNPNKDIHISKALDDYGYLARTKRKGYAEEVTQLFTIGDAKKAGLWGKAGPWSQYPGRMLRARATTYLIRDVYPDIISGAGPRTYEEERDMIDADFTVVPPPEVKKDLADIVTDIADTAESGTFADDTLDLSGDDSPDLFVPKKRKAKPTLDFGEDHPEG